MLGEEQGNCTRRFSLKVLSKGRIWLETKTHQAMTSLHALRQVESTDPDRQINIVSLNVESQRGCITTNVSICVLWSRCLYSDHE